MDNVKFLKKYESTHTVVCKDTRNGLKCIAQSIRKDMYNADNYAVKLYICADGNDDGHMDKIIGEKEFNDNFSSFELQDL